MKSDLYRLQSANIQKFIEKSNLIAQAEIQMKMLLNKMFCSGKYYFQTVYSQHAIFMNNSQH